MAADERDPRNPSGNGSDRRKFLAAASTAATSAGLAGGYGAFGLITQLTDSAGDKVLEEPPGIQKPGHDPCLACGREDRFSRKT